MQNESNTKYTGLEELLAAENYRTNYNNFIVESCIKQVKKPSSLIDFGAGIGTLSLILKEKLNVSPICIEVDQKNTRYLRNRDFQTLKNIEDFEDNTDLIFSSNVLEHIQDDIEILELLRNKLSTDGFLYLYLPANMLLWSKVDESVGHYRRYSRKEIKRKLKATGYKVKSVYYADSMGFLAILVMKLFKYSTDKVIESPASLKSYDSFIFPVSRFLDAIGLKFLFGKNLVIVAQRNH